MELMGHRKLAGMVSDQTFAGVPFIRIDIPDSATQFYSPAAVYCITPTTEAIAKAFAKGNTPEPVHPWEIKQIEQVDMPSICTCGHREELHISDDQYCSVSTCGCQKFELPYVEL